MEQQTNPLDRIEALAAKGRDFRSFAQFELRRSKGESDNDEMWIEGRAVTFNDETVLFEIDGIQYKEVIDPNAFSKTDMTDVIFNYNHGGKVVARTRNKTLQLEIRNDGLYIRARLDGTEEGRRMYEEISGGYIDRMSFAFKTADGGSEYDSKTHKRRVTDVRKLYDVSAVDFPAYEATSISARSLQALDRAEQEKAAAEAECRKRILMLIDM